MLLRDGASYAGIGGVAIRMGHSATDERSRIALRCIRAACYRTDPARNMRRFYRLEIERDLFGAWCVVREWGRVGQAGQVRSSPFPALSDAEAALARQQRAKERRGYYPCTDSCT